MCPSVVSPSAPVDVDVTDDVDVYFPKAVRRFRDDGSHQQRQRQQIYAPAHRRQLTVSWFFYFPLTRKRVRRQSRSNLCVYRVAVSSTIDCKALTRKPNHMLRRTHEIGTCRPNASMHTPVC